ncbi:substrate-binding domain-containing protein [Ochrobactrum teleogrylli]|uniref:substrate-binding domain-containing protein n=1 Tax=Ochrobactrum teleogrylli TaxID=2479765 RepID=UPI00384C75EF
MGLFSRRFGIGLVAIAVTSAAGLTAASAQAPASACVITKTDTNPFFITMKNAAIEEAKKQNIKLSMYAGRDDGDSISQIEALETCILAGVKGILIDPSDSKAVVPAIQKARAAGIMVVAFDSPVEPYDAVDATFATDNFKAGELIGQWVKAKLGDEASNARIAFLDLNASQPTLDVQRDQGFMTGFGIDTKNVNVIGDEDDKRIIGHDVTNGNEEGGRSAMENLLQRDPSLNVVYTINEPAAAGAFETLKSLGMSDKVLLVSIDGGCQGVKNIKAGTLAATSQQYPGRMSILGIQAIRKWVDTGEKPKLEDGAHFFDTGVSLVTDDAVDGVSSISVAEGLEKCWG